MIYNQTLCLGIDLRDFLAYRPTHTTEEKWVSEYNAFWPTYLDTKNHPALFLATAKSGEDLTVCYGVRAEYYFTKFEQMSFRQFKRVLAREIGKTMDMKILDEDIKYFSVTFVLEEEDEVLGSSEQVSDE